jgi:hypothetical protein
LGELEKAREAAASLLRIGQSVGYDLSFAKMAVGLVCLEAGDFDEAERWLLEAALGFEERGG